MKERQALLCSDFSVQAVRHLNIRRPIYLRLGRSYDAWLSFMDR